MNARYRVELTQYERNELGALLSRGEQAARKLKRAQILLAADAGGRRRGDRRQCRGSAAEHVHQASHSLFRISQSIPDISDGDSQLIGDRLFAGVL